VTVVALMVGDIKSGALEDYGYRREDAARLATALGTSDRAFISKASLLLEPAGTAGAFIFVSGQTCYLQMDNDTKKISNPLFRLLTYFTLREKCPSRFISHGYLGIS